MKQYYQMETDEVKKQVNGSLEPLTDAEIRAHQEKYGPNELQEEKKKSVAMIFLEQYKDFLVIILIVSAIISGFMGDMESAIVILIVITINAILGTVQTIKAEKSLNSLKKLSGPEAKVLRNGVVTHIPSREVTVGDIVFLEAGDLVPADGRIIDQASLKIDESALTGESIPVEKSTDVIEGETSLGDRVNMAYSGSFVTYGRGTVFVTGTGMETEVGKIASLLKTTSEKKTPLQVNLDQFGQKLSIIILIFCAFLMVINIVRGGSFGDAFLFAVALAVAAIPEALSSIVTIVLSFGTQKMAKEHAIIRKLQAVEGLGSVSVICSDKTGTLTQNKMTVEACYIPGKSMEKAHIDTDDGDVQLLMKSSVLCSDAKIVNGEEIGDPTETALVSFVSDFQMDAEKIREEHERRSEVPFDSDRKLMSTVHEMEDEVLMIVKGAVDVISGRMESIRKNGKEVKITDEDRKEIAEANQAFSRQGLRVLGFAYKKLDQVKGITEKDETDLTFLGLIAMMDPPRVESKDAVAECIRAGIKPVMITGDHKVTAAAIAKRIGILKDESEACEGAVIENLSDEELKDFVEKISVYARVSPEHKIRIVKAWQEKGNIVSMTGDGVNDAPALKQADVGVAMGITGSEVAKDAASMVLTDDNFATIVKAVENGRNVYRNIKSSIQFLLSGNFGAILAVLYASIAGLPVPFAPVHLLFINLLTDSLPAIALGLEPHRSDVMDEKPRRKDESILTKDFLVKIGTEGLSIGIMTMIGFMIGYTSEGALLGSTMAFGTLCLSRLVHGYNCKSDKPMLFHKGFFNNIYLQGAFMIGFVLITAVLTVPFLQSVFSVVTLSMSQLLTVYGLALLNLPVIQCLKAIRARLK
ncbi:calcium-translocating P-type ATPase, PMCA-type [Sellimonas caecigallum]|uniref:P-type Ca(2+) transporter n=1 Tax=Sellimonas caecigallum TaxID=2592333 RepID=A0ABS7L9P5_9FIRM|nr:calcium-translocating P-type ATPase, PMCA-type [Sellimonas caecigallum]MBY0759810.1 calcium-translocating P-type ATPase, PMCA-type [Sellimonas caecigallum]OUP62476.1 calcium-translocating P-type ATPase, PMCA-type [Drancourtella sp. An177]